MLPQVAPYLLPVLAILSVVSDKLVVLTTLHHLVPYEGHDLPSILVTCAVVDALVDTFLNKFIRCFRLMYAEWWAVVTNCRCKNHDTVL
jgi:hypothetical protein